MNVHSNLLALGRFAKQSEDRSAKARTAASILVVMKHGTAEQKAMVKQAIHPLLTMLGRGALVGGGIGAGVGGLSGLITGGEGGRLRTALRRTLKGGLYGGLGGAAFGGGTYGLVRLSGATPQQISQLLRGEISSSELMSKLRSAASAAPAAPAAATAGAAAPAVSMAASAPQAAISAAPTPAALGRAVGAASPSAGAATSRAAARAARRAKWLKSPASELSTWGEVIARRRNVRFVDKDMLEALQRQVAALPSEAAIPRGLLNVATSPYVFSRGGQIRALRALARSRGMTPEIAQRLQSLRVSPSGAGTPIRLPSFL